MDRDQGRKDAEALRYRLIVRVAHISAEAKRTDRADVQSAAQALRRELEAVDVKADPPAATQTLVAMVPRVERLREQLGLPDHGVSVYPKWMRFSALGIPALLVIGSLALIIERRRSRRRDVDEAAIRKLEEMDGSGG